MSNVAQKPVVLPPEWLVLSGRSLRTADLRHHLDFEDDQNLDATEFIPAGSTLVPCYIANSLNYICPKVILRGVLS